jgi:hypothetical protein
MSLFCKRFVSEYRPESPLARRPVRNRYNGSREPSNRWWISRIAYGRLGPILARESAPRSLRRRTGSSIQKVAADKQPYDSSVTFSEREQSPKPCLALSNCPTRVFGDHLIRRAFLSDPTLATPSRPHQPRPSFPESRG